MSELQQGTLDGREIGSQLGREAGENFPECIWMLDAESERYLFVSQAVESLRGISPETAMGETLRESMSPESHALVVQAIRERMPAFLAGARNPERVGARLQIRQYRFDGRPVDVEISIRLTDGPDAAHVHVVGISRDITRQIRFEKQLQDELINSRHVIGQLRDSSERFREILRELQEKNAQLERISETDRLTGIRNRLSFERRFEEEHARSRRYGHPLSMVLFDLDHFKQINDTYGHSAGDCVLQSTAEQIRQSIRLPDLLARWGGEEFVVLLPQSSCEMALVAAERWRNVIRGIEHPGIGRVTASFGIAELRPDEDRKSFFNRVDRVLYHAKQLGRDVSVAWSDQRFLPLNEDLHWLPEWDSGCVAIDDEHHALVEAANRILRLSEVSGLTDARLADECFGDLVRDLTMHFLHEERLLAEIGYPELPEHHLRHQSLLECAIRIRERVAASSTVQSDALMLIVDHIIVGHLVLEDAKFFPLFAGR